MSIVAATLLGVLVGIMRLSVNWLVRNIALGFIELVRNTPQLVQIIFWYVAVLQTLPGPRQSIVAAGGLAAQHPRPLPAEFRTRRARPTLLWPLALLAGAGNAVRLAPALARTAAGPMVAAAGVSWRWRCTSPASTTSTIPQLRGFNIAGGIQVVPELIALWAGLTDLCRGVHRRDRARARSCRCTRASTRRRSPGAAGRARCCPRSCCRRRCASWCRR